MSRRSVWNASGAPSRRVRMTNRKPPEGTVLFLLGMRPTKPWRIDAWCYAFFTMPWMLEHLRRNPEAGLLHRNLHIFPTPIVVSYWRSEEHLRRFAADGDAPHRPVWRRFNRLYADRGLVGIWHETYVIDRHESIFSGMPARGLARAVGAEEVTAATRTAAKRSAASVG